MPIPPLDTIASSLSPHLPTGTPLLWGSMGKRTAINWIMVTLSLLITAGLGYWLFSSILYWSHHPFTGWSLLALLGIFVLWSFSWAFAYLCCNDWYLATHLLVGANDTHLYCYQKDKPLEVWSWIDLPPMAASIQKGNCMTLVYPDHQDGQQKWTTIARKIQGNLDDYLALQELQKTAHQAEGLYIEVYEFYEKNSTPPKKPREDANGNH